MHQELNEAAGDTGFDDGLDLVVGTVREVRDGPACVDQDLVVKGVNELGEDRERGGNLLRLETSIRYEV
jgi:hypothetical protein